VGTFNPSKLNVRDFFDLSNKTSCALYIINSADPIRIPFLTKQRFPENTKGFFYYNVPRPPSPPIMGDLRFRVTSSNDPSSFNDGSDLLNGPGLAPWGLSLLRLTKTEMHRDLCEQLVADGLISRELLERCLLIWKNSPGLMHCPLDFLYYFNQPIPLTFDYQFSAFSIWIVGKEKLSRWTLKHPYYGKSLTGMRALFLIW
jgi:hypothetical protein